MAEARKSTSFFEGLAHLLRADVLSANWRHVLSSFSPTLMALGLAWVPVAADWAYMEMRKMGWVK